MSHWPEYFYNLKNAIFDINPSTYRGDELHFFGMGKKYKANQADRKTPFDEAYAESSDVYAINNKIAGNAKTVPWRLDIVTGDDIEQVTSGFLFDLLQQPNQEQSMSDFTEAAILHMGIAGEGFLNPIIPSGFSMAGELELLHPQLVEIIPVLSGKKYIAKGYIYRINGKEIPIKAEDITHMKRINPTSFGIRSLHGLSPLSPGHLTYKGLLNNQTASTAIYDNQGAGGILSSEHGEFPMTPDERQIQQDLLDKEINGAEKLGKIYQSGAKIKYVKLGLDPSQMKLIDGKVLTMRDLCNLYDCPSTLFNDATNRVQSNMLVSDPIFWTNAVVPNLNRLEAAYDRAVVQGHSKKDFPSGNSKYVASPDYSKIEALQKDKKVEAEKDKINMQGVDMILKMDITMDGKKAMINEVYDLPTDLVDSLAERPPENNP